MIPRLNFCKAMAASVLVAPALLCFDALALSPPAPPPPTLEDNIATADLVFVGVIERFIFCGSDVHAREEFGRDFAQDSVASRRDIDAFIRVQKVLRNFSGTPVPGVLRVQQLGPRTNAAANVGLSRIFLIKRTVFIPETGAESGLFIPVQTALPVDQEADVVTAIKKIDHQKQR